MIILFSKKIKSNFEKTIENYKKIINYGVLKCPNCSSSDYIRWGHYERNTIFFDEERNCLKSSVIKIQRIKCNSCNKTHALLSFGIIPYK